MMKKIAVVFLVFTLSMLFAAGMVMAVDPTYPTTIYQGKGTSTFDGYWTTSTEWDDAAKPLAMNTASFVFRNKWVMVTTGGFKIFDQYLIEVFGDNTNDADDYVQICYDNTAVGGAAPTASDIRIDIVGHNNATVKMYIGTGTGWALASNINDTTVAQSLNVSKLGTNPHWITEFRINKMTNGLGMNNAIRVAVYDASNPSAGVKAYPPTSQQDVPSSWALNAAGMTQLPTPRASAFCNVTVLKGWTWYFFAHSLGGVGTQTYQWYEGSTMLAGQNSLVLAVTKNTAGTYNYFLRVTDSAGSVIDTNIVTLTVIG
jgi:hypothetical protein